jgi:hypothetical protein
MSPQSFYTLNNFYTLKKARGFIRRLDNFCRIVFDNEILWSIYREERSQYETLRDFVFRYLILRASQKHRSDPAP